ncbi:transcriptional regulator [Longimycelium tulufanense]|uniref:Transcriptional regulator n=1 Tax=Longimycelium tulufanense TaxID=907463 RepID=A0A8J3C5U0_9PSEU|nr:transcriptional regulator [Longimycelium tulufanense]
MAKAVATLPRVFLGEALKQLRADAGTSLDDAARAIGKDRARLIKVLEGRATLTADELATLLDFLGAKPKHRKEILALGVEARKRSNGSPYMDLAPGSFRRVAQLEALATEIWSYEKGIFPYHLQAPEYVEAIMDASSGIWWEASEEERANRVAFRLERQRLVLGADKPKKLHLLFTDDSLVAEVGSPAIMKRQLAHVLHMIDQYKNLTVQIVPTTARNNPAQHGGLNVLHFGDVLRPVGFLPVVYGPSTYFDKTEDTNRLTRAFTRLRELALSPEDTRRVIEEKL